MSERDGDARDGNTNSWYRAGGPVVRLPSHTQARKLASCFPRGTSDAGHEGATVSASGRPLTPLPHVQLKSGGTPLRAQCYTRLLYEQGAGFSALLPAVSSGSRRLEALCGNVVTVGIPTKLP
ncbi:hypothetical protein CBL_09300 [Carabus blaptoides fortunei]